MSLVHSYDGADVTGAIAIVTEKGFRASAELGQVETITVEVDDPNGSRDFHPYKTWLIRETTAPSNNKIVWAGIVGDQLQSYGAGQVIFPIEPGNVWELQLHEGNHWLSRRILRGVAANRVNAETVSARVDALLGMPIISSVIADHGLVEPSGAMMDPEDYTQRTALDLLQDCALISGYGFHLRYREASSDFELIFLNFETSALDDSGVIISTDVDDGGYAPFDGYKRKGGASRIASGVLTPYPNGVYYAEDAATVAEFGAIDQVAPTPAVKTKTAAIALTNRLLQQHDRQDERVTDLTIQVPAANVNDLRKGQLVQARLPRFKATGGMGSWEELRYARAVIRGVGRPAGEPQDRYDVALELVPLAAGYPVTPAATHARLQSDAHLGTPAGPTDYLITWGNTGDSPGGGQPYDPKVGLVDYLDDGAGHDIGFTALGTGTLNVYLRMSFAAVESGDQTAIFAIYKNGVSTLSQTFSTSGGLRFVSHECDFDGDVAVVPGDEIIVHLLAPNATGTWTVPAGVGGSHAFVVDGSLTP